MKRLVSPPRPWGTRELDILAKSFEEYADYTFLGNCPATPPLSQHFALSEKGVLA